MKKQIAKVLKNSGFGIDEGQESVTVFLNCRVSIFEIDIALEKAGLPEMDYDRINDNRVLVTPRS